MDQPTDQDTDSLQLQRRLDQLQSQMDLMKKASARDQAIARVRDSVWRMVSDGDIGYVLNSVGESLVELGIAHRKCEINLIDDLVNPNLVVAHATRGGDDWDNTDAHFFNRTVIGFWQEKKPVYRSDLAKEDLFGEAKLLSRGIRSVIDVPFSHGTLAVNSCEPSAFQPHDIETLGMLAVALSEAFVRLEDIRKLKKASQQLHNLHEISRLTISTLDRKEILDTLAKQVVATGVLRSLAVALVDRQAGRVVRVQGYHLDREVISSSDEGDIVSYDLDDPDILAETVRTGEIQIVLEWDERFTPRDSTITPESRRGQVAYFIPVKAHDEVIAVVATGSTVADQKETTDRLIEMQPLWDQVAVALSNAAHYEAAQAEIDERKKLAAALTREGEMRDAVACVQVAIADMNQPADLTRVVKLIREQVERVGVTCDSLSIQIVDPSGTEFVSVGDGLSPHDQEVLNNLSMWRDDSVRGNAQAYPWVIEVWRTGEPRFGHSARIGGIRGEGNARELSLIDVPFSGGTLAINNRQLHAYNDEDVAVLQRFATALSDGFERFVIIIERNQAERHKEAVNRIREQVWFMEDDEDLVKVLDTVGDALRDGGVTFCDCDINLVEVTGEASSVRHYNPQRKTWVESPNDTAIRLVQLWSERTVAYRRDLHQEDGYDEAGQIEKAFGHRARSVVDVPFSDGTLAVNHDQPDAFSESDLGLLQEIAAVLTEGFNRVRDLTTLRENERQYRSLFENMVDGFALHEIVLDEDGTPADYVFLEMNGAFEQLTGLRRESVIGRRVTEVLPGIEDDPTDWIGRYGRVVATGEATSFESYLAQLGRWYQVTAYRPKDGQFAVVFANITERKQMEEDLRESEERYRISFRTSRDPINVFTLDGKILDANERLVEVSGYSLDEICSLSLIDLYPTADGHETRQRIQVLREGKESSTFETNLLTKQGKLVPVEIATAALTDCYGHETVIQANVREITDRKLLEQEVIHLERMRVSGELAAGVSHNLNNMLTAVLAPAQILLRKSADPEIRREAETIMTAGRRARDLVMHLNQSVRSRREGSLVPVSLVGQIQEVIQLARPRWKDEPESRGVAVAVLTELAETPDVQGDPAEMDDVILNLLLNAVDALPEGGTITVATQAVDAGILLTVSDTGTGMDEETCRRVFEPFFTTKVGVGSGLGLSTVHGTVSRWGGRIEVDSTPGEGTTFTLWLPAWTESCPL